MLHGGVELLHGVSDEVLSVKASMPKPETRPVPKPEAVTQDQSVEVHAGELHTVGPDPDAVARDASGGTPRRNRERSDRC